MEAKERIRVEVRQRLELTSKGWREEASGVILEQLEQLPQFAQAGVVALYWSLPDEVQTHRFIERWSRTKTILLPVMEGENLHLHPFAGRDKMVNARYHIAEPITEAWKEWNRVDLLIVPGVAFDPQGGRIGRGKGFYDRLLSQIKAPRVGVCFECQLFGEVPTEKHDQLMDYLICGNSLTTKSHAWQHGERSSEI